MSKIGWHTRLYSDNTQKISGGSFGGAIDLDTVNRLVDWSFDVVVKPSGQPVLVDWAGREVRLYLSVDVEKTHKGAEAIKNHRLKAAMEQAAIQERLEREKKEISRLMNGLSHEEILRRLRG